MPTPTVPEGPLERLGEDVFHNRDGRGLGPTLGPGLSAEHQRELVERILGERANFEGQGLPARPAPPIGLNAAPAELDDLSARDDEPDGLNETQAEMYAHARAQGGPRKLGGGDTEGA